MPPKKRGENKKKKGGNKKTAKVPLLDTEPTPLTEDGKDFFSVQIRDLEYRLARFKDKCYQLETINATYNEQFEQLTTDKADIAEFLKKELQRKTDEIADLKDRLLGLQEARDSEKEKYETKLQKTRHEMQEVKDTLTQENMMLTGKLQSLEEFKLQREENIRRLDERDKEILRLKETHEEDLYTLEKKAVIDKDRLKKEMVTRVNQVASEFRKVSNKQMAETTKRTIRENVSINAQLTKMSDKTMELIKENDDLRESEKKHRMQIELLEANEVDLARKNSSNQKIIRMLTDKCREQEIILEEMENREKIYEEADEASEQMKKKHDQMKEALDEIRPEYEGLIKEQENLKASTIEAKRQSKAITQVLFEAATAIKLALSTSDNVEMNDVERRNLLLKNLLNILSEATTVTLPDVEDAKPDASFRSASVPATVYEEDLDSITTSGVRESVAPSGPLVPFTIGPIPHYALGDLGLVPRVREQHVIQGEKTRELSATSRTHLGKLRHINTQTVATQTLPFSQPGILADPAIVREIAAIKREAPLRTVHPLPRSKQRPPGFPVPLS